MSYMKLESIGKTDWKRLDELFMNFIPEHKEVWLFGMGVYAKSFRTYLDICKVDIAGYVVSDPSKEKLGGGKLSSIIYS